MLQTKCGNFRFRNIKNIYIIGIGFVGYISNKTYHFFLNDNHSLNYVLHLERAFNTQIRHRRGEAYGQVHLIVGISFLVCRNRYI